MEWNGVIRNSEITNTFFSYSNIALQEAMLHRVTGC